MHIFWNHTIVRWALPSRHEIEWQRKHVIVCFLLQVIVTVPLFLLKKGRLKFTPGLPTRKQAAISNLGAGLIEKVYQYFCCTTYKKFQTLISQTFYFRCLIFGHFFSHVWVISNTNFGHCNGLELIKSRFMPIDAKTIFTAPSRFRRYKCKPRRKVTKILSIHCISWAVTLLVKS